MDIGFSNVGACGRCWVAIPAIASVRRLKKLWNCLRLNLIFAFVQSLVNWYRLILVFRGFDVGVMVDCVVLKVVLWEIQGFDLFGCVSCRHLMSGVTRSCHHVVSVWFPSRCVPGTDNSHASCSMFFQVSSFVLNKRFVLFPTDT